MSRVYHLHTKDLDQNFLEEIKATFGDKEIKLIISEVEETEYLLESNNNKRNLLKAVDNIKNHKDLVEIDWVDLIEVEK